MSVAVLQLILFTKIGSGLVLAYMTYCANPYSTEVISNFLIVYAISLNETKHKHTNPTFKHIPPVYIYLYINYIQGHYKTYT